MNTTLKSMIKTVLPKTILNTLIIQPLILYRSLKPIAPRVCNICGFEGYFERMGKPPRLDAKCPSCKSLERHRLLMLAIDRGEVAPEITVNDSVLHFAPEAILEERFRKNWKNYTTADLFKNADLKLNLEEIELPDNSVKMVIANHVLEHVDDNKASLELHRILVEGGILVCMVPIIEGWESTYENVDVKTEQDRWLHFGQGDHVRFYGSDFRERIAKGGLRLVKEITAEGDDVITYGLNRGEKVFVFQKP